MVFISRFLIFGARLFRLSPCSTSGFAAKTGSARKMLCKKNRTYRSRSHEPTAHARRTTNRPSTTHRTIPQARSFERGSANRMRLISRNARLCAQALCAGPSLHDGAGDKPCAHTTAQTIQKTSQEKEEKGKEEKKVSQHCDGHYAGSQMQGPITARREGSCSHNAHTKHIAAPDERPCPLRRRTEQTARTGSSNNVRSSQIAARPSTPFSHILSDIDEKAESAAKESLRI